MNVESHNSSQTESRWRRPNFDITIVSIYLLFSAAVGLSLAGYGLLFAINGWIISAPLGISAGLAILGAILLLRRNQNGVYVSLVALIFWAIFYSWVVGFSAQIVTLSTTFTSLIVPTAVICVLLAIGWKRVQWR